MSKHPVFRLTPEAYYNLQDFAAQNPEAYLNPDIDFGAVLSERGVQDYAKDATITTTRPISLTMDGIPPRNDTLNQADRQALDYYHAFDGMDPKQATDELLWAWMTHFRLHRYSLGRWRRTHSVKNLYNYVRDHWFVKDSGGGLWQHNTASRTWWIAHIANKAAAASAGAFTAEDALEIFSLRPTFYHAIMRYSFARHPVVLSEVVRAILVEMEGVKAEDGIYALMGSLNVAGGTRMIEMLPRPNLRKIVEVEADAIMSNADLVADRTKIRNRKPLRSLSLGAGVQSTVLALMADRGEYGLEKPDVAVFADTGWEPASVYEHLDWLESQLSYEVVRVKAADVPWYREGTIRENILEGTNPNRGNYLAIPAFLTNSDGSKAIARRQCTAKYKIDPINYYLRGRIGAKKGRRAPKDKVVEIWMGISVDEVYRQKDSLEEWAYNRYPLIELGISRAQLQEWFTRNYPDRYLPRSACIGCPYKSNAEWKWLKVNDPTSFDDAVFIDRALREIPVVKNAIATNSAAYLHRSRVPLAEVDLDGEQDYDNLMVQECEGVCGV
ncbi:MAG: DUF6339 family protein [Chloroflexi bacterium]|nr:DUF6339 family protein [Chloroflexota bacterium]